jgi:superfamily I DNA and RNA helicase
MVEIIKGLTKKNASSELLIKFFKGIGQRYSGLLYIGYPILYGGDENITVDALWVSETYGIIIFDLIENSNEVDGFEARQDKIFGLIDSQVRAYPELKRNRRDLAVNIEIISFAKGLSRQNGSKALFSEDEKILKSLIDNITLWDRSDLFPATISVIQSVINLKSKTKRTNLQKENSKGHRIKEIEDTIATLDRHQEKAVIEYFEGVQRIRGLAGSGKTIVLALKAAYLHTQNPDWTIAVTFNTRSLKSQFKNLIERFCIDKKREAPDWNKIKIINAWGSPKDNDVERGIYYDYCVTHGIEYFDFKKAKSFILTQNENDANPLGAVSEKAIKETKTFIQKYDAILVDEAQDLSESFIELCYKFLKPPKRLIYAYDELQKLNEGTPIRNPREFILNSKDEFSDTILNRCYRNSRPLLVTAHALGFGIYRKNDKNETDLVQFFDQPQLWKDVGYNIEEGKLESGCEVKLARTTDSSPNYLEKHSDIDDLLVFKKFDNKNDQADWVANEIEINIKEDELLYNDIIVINPIALVTKHEVAIIRSKLLEKGIDNHIAGEFNADLFYQDGSITFTGINRAKGNEVPMVYIINCQDCYTGFHTNLELIKRRNILFTAITRSKAWVRVVGIGDDMDKLISEYNEVKANNFTLQFKYPSKEQIKRMNLIHRDITDKVKSKLKQDADVLNNLPDIIGRIERGDTYIEDYPHDLQPILKKLVG